jgi:hypothetical protein
MTIPGTILAVVAGLVAGGIVNMALIVVGSAVIPAPPGVDPSDAESIARGIDLFETRHFIFPLLAHALGTFVGALVGGYIGWLRRRIIVIIIAAAFFLGGLSVVLSIPAPISFEAVDLIFAYFPMAAFALWILERRDGRSNKPEQ